MTDPIPLLQTTLALSEQKLKFDRLHTALGTLIQHFDGIDSETRGDRKAIAAAKAVFESMCEHEWGIPLGGLAPIREFCMKCGVRKP